MEGESPNFQQVRVQHSSSLLLEDVIIQLRYLESILLHYYIKLLNYIIVIYETYISYIYNEYIEFSNYSPMKLGFPRYFI